MHNLRQLRKLTAILLVLALLCACGTPQEAGETPNDALYDEQLERLNEAFELYEGYQYEAAAALFEEVLAIGGDEELMEIACIQLFYTYVELADYDNALRTLQEGAESPGTEAITGMLAGLLDRPDTVIEGSGIERWYPITTYPVWLDGGSRIAAAEGRLIRYVGLDNETVHEVLLDSIWFGSLDITDHMIISVNGYPCVLQEDGEWRAFNVSFFGTDGSELLSLDRVDLGSLLMGGAGEREIEKVMMVNVLAVDADHVAMFAQDHVFLCQLSTGAMTLLDDLSEWLIEQPDPDNRGILGELYRDGNAVYYLRYDQEDEQTGTCWRLTAAGTELLFDGRTFAYLIVENGFMVLVDAEEEGLIHWTGLDDLELHSVALEQASTYFRVDGPNISTPGNAGIYCIDTATGEVSLYQLPHSIYMYAGTRMMDGALQIVYTDAEALEAETVYQYDVENDILYTLPNFEIYADTQLHPLGTHYLEYGEGYDGFTTVRVLPLAPTGMLVPIEEEPDPE